MLNGLYRIHPLTQTVLLYTVLFLTHNIPTLSVGTTIEGNLGLRNLPKDTSNCRLEGLEIESANFWLVDDPLWLEGDPLHLSHNCPNVI